MPQPMMYLYTYGHVCLLTGRKAGDTIMINNTGVAEVYQVFTYIKLLCKTSLLLD